MPANANTRRRNAMSSAAIHNAPSPVLARVAWQDPKRYLWLLGLVVPTLPFIADGLVHLTCLGAMWFFGPVLVFVFFPLAVLAVGLDPPDPPHGAIKGLKADRYYHLWTYAVLA